MIEFIKQKSDDYLAKVGEIDVRLSPIGYNIVAWETIREIPCEYDGCPEGDVDECMERHDDHCPKEIMTRSVASDDLASGFAGWDEVKKAVREIFKRGHGYPKVEAKRLATEEWTFVEKQSRNRHLHPGPKSILSFSRVTENSSGAVRFIRYGQRTKAIREFQPLRPPI